MLKYLYFSKAYFRLIFLTKIIDSRGSGVYCGFVKKLYTIYDNDKITVAGIQPYMQTVGLSGGTNEGVACRHNRDRIYRARTCAGVLKDTLYPGSGPCRNRCCCWRRRCGACDGQGQRCDGLTRCEIKPRPLKPGGKIKQL